MYIFKFKYALFAPALFASSCGGNRQPPVLPVPAVDTSAQMHSVSGTSGDVCAWIEGGKNSETPYCEGLSHFYRGKLGNEDMALEMYHSRIWGDTAWLNGAWWLAGDCATKEVQGSYSIANYKLQLKDAAGQPVFDFERFDGLSVTGKALYGGKTQSCNLKGANPGFDFVGAFGQLIGGVQGKEPWGRFLTLLDSTSNRKLRVDYAKGKDFFASEEMLGAAYEDWRMERFDPWRVELSASSMEGESHRVFWLPLFGGAPAVLFGHLVEYSGPVSDKGDPDVPMSDAGTFYHFHKLYLFVQKDGAWKAADLQYLTKELDALLEDTPDAELSLMPDHIRFDNTVWTWTSGKFVRKK